MARKDDSVRMRYIKVVAAIGVGIIVGAAIMSISRPTWIPLVVGVTLGVSLSPIAKWTDGIAYGAVIGDLLGLTIGSVAANGDPAMADVLVGGSTGAFFGGVLAVPWRECSYVISGCFQDNSSLVKRCPQIACQSHSRLRASRLPMNCKVKR